MAEQTNMRIETREENEETYFTVDEIRQQVLPNHRIWEHPQQLGRHDKTGKRLNQEMERNNGRGKENQS